MFMLILSRSNFKCSLLNKKHINLYFLDFFWSLGRIKNHITEKSIYYLLWKNSPSAYGSIGRTVSTVMWTGGGLDVGWTITICGLYILWCHCDLLGHPRSKFNIANDRAYTNSYLRIIVTMYLPIPLSEVFTVLWI